MPAAAAVLLLVVAGLILWGVVSAEGGPLASADTTPYAYQPVEIVPVEEPVIPGGHNEYDDLIVTALQANGVPAGDARRYAVLVKAIVSHESGWNPAARGDYDPSRCPQPYRGRLDTAGYCSLGLGQVHRYWHPDLAAQYDLLDPAQNLQAVCVIVGRLRAAVGDDFERIAAAYNGGTAAGLAWPRVTDQVARYVAAVTGRVVVWTGGGVV